MRKKTWNIRFSSISTESFMGFFVPRGTFFSNKRIPFCHRFSCQSEISFCSACHAIDGTTFAARILGHTEHRIASKKLLDLLVIIRQRIAQIHIRYRTITHYLAPKSTAYRIVIRIIAITDWRNRPLFINAHRHGTAAKLSFRGIAATCNCI